MEMMDFGTLARWDVAGRLAVADSYTFRNYACAVSVRWDFRIIPLVSEVAGRSFSQPQMIGRCGLFPLSRSAAVRGAESDTLGLDVPI